MQWNQSQLDTITRYKRKCDVPKSDRQYKCPSCAISFDVSVSYRPGTDLPHCPLCGTTEVVQMCPLDHHNCGKDSTKACNHTKVFPYAEICPVCGEPVCPACGSHDVEVMSRITGYLSDYAGWGAGKKAEFKDRVRYNL